MYDNPHEGRGVIYWLNELTRQFNNTIQIGLIEEVDHEAQKARVRIGKILTHWLPWMSLRTGTDKAWWALEKGEQVIVASLSGNPVLGVILGAVYQGGNSKFSLPDIEKRPVTHCIIYEDGTLLSYNKEAHLLNIEIKEKSDKKPSVAIKLDATAKKITIESADGDIELITKNIKITADGDVDISAKGNVNISAQKLNVKDP